MSKVFDWSTSAGSNNDAPPDGWPENMLPGKVNDCAREMMSAIAAWYADQKASLTTAGTTLAYTLATNSGYDALSDIPLLVFRLHAANTGAVTLNIDGLGAKPLRKTGTLEDYASGDLTSGQTVVAAYNTGTDDFEVIGPNTATPGEEFSSGTVMLFVQTAAPTGWTKLITHNNKALRLVSGTASTGGTTAFTSVFTSRTIAIANLPAHSHGPGTLTGGTSENGEHNHDVNNGTNVMHTPDSNDANSSTGVNQYTSSDITLDAGGDHTHDVAIDGGLTGSIGSGTAMDFAVQYVDVIMADKD